MTRRDVLVTKMSGETLICGPEAAAIIVEAIRTCEAMHPYRSPRKWRVLCEAAADVVARAQRGRSDVREEADPTESTHGRNRDEVTTAQAADLLGCSPRHVRRLVDDGHLGRTRKVKSQHRIALTAVQAYLEGRRTA